MVLRFAAAAIWPTINDVRTGATPEYPGLQAQRFDKPLGQVYAASVGALNDMGLEVTKIDDPMHIQAVATTRLMRFKDDVTIAFHREGDATVVHVRSKSRIGKGDFGANARRIQEFQARLASRLKT